MSINSFSLSKRGCTPHYSSFPELAEKTESRFLFYQGKWSSPIFNLLLLVHEAANVIGYHYPLAKCSKFLKVFQSTKDSLTHTLNCQ